MPSDLLWVRCKIVCSTFHVWQSEAVGIVKITIMRLRYKSKMWAYWQEKDKGVASADEALQHECKTEEKMDGRGGSHLVSRPIFQYL